LKPINEKKIQIGLIILGILLIVFTYFVYPKINTKIVEEVPETKNDESLSEVDTSFTNVEFKGVTNKGNPYIVHSEFAEINPEDINIVFMSFVTAKYYYKNNRTIIITGDEGKLNKINGDLNFKKNVKMVDNNNNKLTANYLDMIASEDYVIAYNSVKVLTNEGESVLADRIKFDAIKNTLKISMLEQDEQIKIKLIE
jgi:LPS export ABC transporter protein LptC